MQKLILVLVAAFLLLPTIVLGIDCKNTFNPVDCGKIKSSDFSESDKDLAYSTLLYTHSHLPNHTFIENYNSAIKITSPPRGTVIKSTSLISNGWLSFLTVFPSVYEDDVLYVPSNITFLSAYDYQISVPSNYRSRSVWHTSKGDCKRKYSLKENNAQFNYYFNNQLLSASKKAKVEIKESGTIKAELSVFTRLKIKHYRWKQYRIGKLTGTICKYSHTNYENHNLKFTDFKDVQLYTQEAEVNFTIIQNFPLTKGKIKANNYSFLRLKFNNSELRKQRYNYDLIFDKKPYHFAYLRATKFNQTVVDNLYSNNDTVFVKDNSGCSISTSNHFFTKSKPCIINLENKSLDPLKIEKRKVKLNLLIYFLMFALIIYLLYRMLQSQFKKLIIPIILIILLVPIPLVSANNQKKEECGLTNLASCLPEKIYKYTLYIINAPIIPLLAINKKLIIAIPSIDTFKGVWSVVRYILSFFYVFLFLYSGYIFLTSNTNPIQRGKAKDLLKNTTLMVVLIHASFYIYELIISLSSTLNAAIVNLVDPKFFILGIDNISNLGLQFIFTSNYAIALVITMFMLTLRYVILAVGVIILPLAIFCYFTPPLKSYGKFLITMLLALTFVVFIDLLIILACSLIIKLPIFSNLKVLVMIICFSLINYSLWLCIKFAIKNSATASLKEDFGQAVKYLTMAV